MKDKKRILALFLVLPQSLEKSAHMLIFREMVTLGWDVTVLSVQQKPSVTEIVDEQWQGVRLLRIPCQSCTALKPQSQLRRLLSKRSFPDKYTAAIDEFSARSHQLHREQPFDAVLSLYHPMSSHKIAQSFSRKVSIPWIAMTKDYYSWPQAYVKGVSKQLKNFIKKLYERKAYTGANILLVSDDKKTTYIQQLVPGIKIKTFPHCYDKFSFQNPQKSHETKKGKFILTTIGLTDRNERENIDGLFCALSELIEENRMSASNFQMRFVGHNGYYVKQCVQKHLCKSLVEILPPVSHSEAMQELTNATCLFFSEVSWGSRRRLADYVGSRQPILAYPEYVDTLPDKVLKQYGAARIACDVTSLKAAILELYQQYQEHQKLELPVNKEVVNSFSSHYRAEELDDLLSEMLQHSTIPEQEPVDVA